MPAQSSAMGLHPYFEIAASKFRDLAAGTTWKLALGQPSLPQGILWLWDILISIRVCVFLPSTWNCLEAQYSVFTTRSWCWTLRDTRSPSTWPGLSFLMTIKERNVQEMFTFSTPKNEEYNFINNSILMEQVSGSHHPSPSCKVRTVPVLAQGENSRVRILSFTVTQISMKSYFTSWSHSRWTWL